MINRDIKKPVEPKKPDSTIPVFEESQEWTEYYKRKAQYDRDSRLYDIKLKILATLDSMMPAISGCIGGDRESIIAELRNNGIDIDERIIDSYLEKLHASQERLGRHRQILHNIGDLEARDTVGISYLNDKLKQEGYIFDEEGRQEYITQDFIEQIAMQIVIGEYSHSDFETMKDAYLALKEMGYQGNFGELEKFVPAFEQITALQSENTVLKRENKEIRDEKQLLLTSNQDLQKENGQLREENNGLRQQIDQVIQNVKKYKDFVLDTVRKMPIIGKMMAKRIQKDEKKLGEGIER